MNPRRTTGLLAGLLSLGLAVAGPARAAGPADVHLRVEGDGATLVPRTAVTTTTAPVGKPGQGTCSGTSGLGALDRGTGGDWNGVYGTFGPQYQVTAIKGETHTAPSGASSGTYWAFWLNYRYSDTGLCDTELQAGDDVLLFPDCFGSGCTNPTPLRIAGVPATARPGDSATIKVVEYSAVSHYPDPTETVEAPASGATVTGGAQPVTTGADGTATITFAGSGPESVQATKPHHVRTVAEPVCVTTGSDGACGGTVPGPPCQTSGSDGRCGTVDREPPTVGIAGIRNGQVFARRHGPRTLHGAVSADPSGLKVVQLRLKRRAAHRRCAVYDGSHERFAAGSCYRNGRWVAVGDRMDWSYLLPSRLGPGRYTLEVVAIDGAGNPSHRVRAVFRVR